MGEESNSIRCTWLHQFRIVREGISEKEYLCRVHDSGWTKRSNMPDAWREIQLTQGSKWTKGEADLIDRFCVLGVRIEGRGSAKDSRPWGLRKIGDFTHEDASSFIWQTTPFM